LPSCAGKTKSSREMRAFLPLFLFYRNGEIFMPTVSLDKPHGMNGLPLTGKKNP